MNRLNLGCGTQVIPGYENIDYSPNVILSRLPALKGLLRRLNIIKEPHMVSFPKEIRWMSLPGGLTRYPDASCDRIYTSHFLEHLTRADALATLAHCHRLLCAGGLLRVVLPDTVLAARKYLRETERLIEGKQPSSAARDEFARHLASAYFEGHRAGHRYLWDEPSLRAALRELGFSSIELSAFREGRDPTMAAHDNRGEDQDSLYLEAVR